MTIATEITRIKTNIENAYTKAQEKGATIPDVKNSTNLAFCIETITTGGTDGGYTEIPKYKVENGVANCITIDVTGAFDDIVTIESNALYYQFCNNTKVTGVVSFPNLTTVKSKGLENSFMGCTGITKVDLKSLKNVATNGLSNAFNGCSNVTEVDLSSLESLTTSYALSNAFYNCNKLTKVNLDSLKSVGNYTLSSTFHNCASLTSISFPSLSSITNSAFNSNTFPKTLSEIHFRSDMQSVVEGLSYYSSKFGATNATFYYDL